MKSFLELLCISSLMSIHFCSEFQYDFKQENLCNRSLDLTVDSILMNSKTELYLYSNRDYYKLNLNEKIDKYQVVWRRDINSNITPPVDVIFTRDQYLYIYNLNLPKLYQAKRDPITTEWSFESKKFPAVEVPVIEKLFVWGALHDLRRYGEEGLELKKTFDNPTDSGYLLAIDSSESGPNQVELIDKNVGLSIGTGFFDSLNETKITAAFFTNDQTINLFAGRYWCQMTVQLDKKTPFCEVKDISEWVDCQPSSSTNGSTLWFWIIILSLIGIPLLLLILIYGTVIFLSTTRKNKKQGMSDRKEPKNLSSSVASDNMSVSTDIHQIDSTTGQKTSKIKLSALNLGSTTDSEQLSALENKQSPTTSKPDLSGKSQV